MKITSERRKLYRRFAIGYLGIVYLMLVVIGFSIAQGAGWKPVISGAPVYLTFFVVVTYQFIKELRKLGRKERGEPEPPPKKWPWEEE